MTRRTAAERHSDSAPDRAPGAESGADLLDVLIAFHHPTRRWLCEVLSAEGPANVGMLAERTGLAVGSVSHHLKALHRHGFVEPAPELARDTRQSWWRLVARDLSWLSDDFVEGTMGRRLAEDAEVANFRHHVRAVRQWMAVAHEVPDEWRRAAVSTDTYVRATVEQTTELSRRVTELLVDWSRECRADERARPDAVRRPVRAHARVFPSGPVAPERTR
ncbi:ArsR/SmtB family transcription factor [Nocardioides guangzhouensis]|nr:helix-turn-helix domain-containing protein [Nocardioides guangzhouensis]